MKKIVLTFGAISGAILIAFVAILMPLCMNGTISFDRSEIIGYSAMVASFLLVFFGIRSYRDNVAGGTIGFGKAFQVGILITLISCACYVVTWQIYYYGFAPDFFETYTAFTVEKMAEEGASAAEIERVRRRMTDFAELYRNPLVNAAVTFLEPFPVGLIVTLVSAAILRRRKSPPAPERAAAGAL